MVNTRDGAIIINKKAKVSSTRPKQDVPSNRKRWINIGPGIVLALAISALIGATWIRTEISERKQAQARPIIERQVISSSFEEKLGPTPEVKFVLDNQEKLQLSFAQISKLTQLQNEWTRFSAPKLAEAHRMAQATQQYLKSAEQNKRTPIAQVQNHAAPLIALSREISSARRSYWSKATSVLTKKQRSLMQAAREETWRTRQLH